MCSSPGQGRVALDLLGQHSEREQSVPVSVGDLGLLVIVSLGVDLRTGVHQVANTLPQLWQHPVQEQFIPFACEQ